MIVVRVSMWAVYVLRRATVRPVRRTSAVQSIASGVVPRDVCTSLVPRNVDASAVTGAPLGVVAHSGRTLTTRVGFRVPALIATRLLTRSTWRAAAAQVRSDGFAVPFLR